MANKRMPTIGNRSDATSAPDAEGSTVGTGDMSLGVANHNYNLANFVNDPDVFNASPATRKNYSWNRGETGNAT